MKNQRATGIAFIMISAIIYGFTPVLTAISYRYGNNGVNMAFLRALIPIPVLALIVRAAGYNLRITARQWRTSLLAGCLGFGYVLFLYLSYSDISVGLATTLHFLYPLYVVLYGAVFKKQRLSRLRWTGIILCLTGVLLSVDLVGAGQVNLRGVALALASGLVYACYILLLEREAKEPLPVYHLMLIISVTGVFVCGAVGLMSGRLTFAMEPSAWLYIVPSALLVSVGACTLFQAGIRRIGGTDAAVYSLLEPITSILFGCLLMGDLLSTGNIVGSTLILLGLFCNAKAEQGRSGEYQL